MTTNFNNPRLTLRRWWLRRKLAWFRWWRDFVGVPVGPRDVALADKMIRAARLLDWRYVRVMALTPEEVDLVLETFGPAQKAARK